MALIVVSAYPQPTDTKDINAVNAILSLIVNEINGSLSEENVATGTPAKISTAGAVGDTGIALGNHTHAVQGFETLAADPTTGNFVGRCYENSVSHTIRRCTSAAGSGTFVTIAPLTASDLPDGIGDRVSTGGADPIADNGISERMLGRGIAYDSVLPADVSFGNAVYADLWTGITFTCHGTQVVTLLGEIRAVNANAAARNCGLRLRESGATLHKFSPIAVSAPANNQENGSCGIRWAGTFAGGSHTLTIQGFASGAGVTATKNHTADGETLAVSSLQVVIG